MTKTLKGVDAQVQVPAALRGVRREVGHKPYPPIKRL